MPLPILSLEHEAGKVARRVAGINSVAVKCSFPTPVDLSIGIVALSPQQCKADERNIRRHKTHAPIADFWAIGSYGIGIGLEVIVVHDPAHVLHTIEQGSSNV